MNLTIMKETVVRTAKMSALKLKKHSPEILTGVAIVTGIAATATAIERTLKLDDILAEIEHDQENLAKMKAYKEAGTVTEIEHDQENLAKMKAYKEAGTVAEEQYSDEQPVQAQVVYGAKAVIKIANHYKLPIALTIASVLSAFEAYNIMSKRYTGLVEAYTATLGAYEAYRQKIKDKFGEADEKVILSEVLDDAEKQAKVNKAYEEETGKEPHPTAKKQEMSIYARWFDEASVYWRKSPGYNSMFVRSQERYWNQRLRIDGHVFLNQVYESLGLPHTTAGAVVGWIFDPSAGDEPQIDFGLLNGDIEAYRDFLNGRERSVLLDFNVDGLIYDMI